MHLDDAVDLGAPADRLDVEVDDGALRPGRPGDDLGLDLLLGEIAGVTEAPRLVVDVLDDALLAGGAIRLRLVQRTLVKAKQHLRVGGAFEVLDLAALGSGVLDDVDGLGLSDAQFLKHFAVLVAGTHLEMSGAVVGDRYDRGAEIP